MKITNKIKTIILNDTKTQYNLSLSRHSKQQREYKSNKFENRLLIGLDIGKIDTLLNPYLIQILSKPSKYLFVINKTEFDNKKLCLLISVNEDKMEYNSYNITIITALHRDTESIMFSKIKQENRIYTSITYSVLLNTINPHDAVPSKKPIFKSNMQGLKIIKKISNKDKYFKYKNIMKLCTKNSTQVKLHKLLNL